MIVDITCHYLSSCLQWSVRVIWQKFEACWSLHNKDTFFLVSYQTNALNPSQNTLYSRSLETHTDWIRHKYKILYNPNTMVINSQIDVTAKKWVKISFEESCSRAVYITYTLEGKKTGCAGRGTRMCTGEHFDPTPRSISCCASLFGGSFSPPCARVQSLPIVFPVP